MSRSYVGLQRFASGAPLVFAAVLLGRDNERRAIERALASARSGRSVVLALVGEPGIGKTELLAYAERRARSLRVLRARGVPSEARLPYAGLSELLRPQLDHLADIPAPQASALEGALALRESGAVDRFAVGVATLSLLAASAEQSPLLLLLDDAHLLDPASAEALRFALRRLLAEPIVALLAVRAGESSLLDGADIPALTLEGLGPADAATLLGSPGSEIEARLHGETGGNPLALLELRGEAITSTAAGTPLQLSSRISRAFARRADGLPAPVGRLLILAAASHSGKLAAIERAAAVVRLDPAELHHAEEAGLVRLADGVVEFSHPLARAAIYSEAPGAVRRAAHAALAQALGEEDEDERAWHLALASAGTDASAAQALEHAAARAHVRGALADAAAALERAATLSPRRGERERLLLGAAESAWSANQAERARALLARASPLGRDRAAVPIDVERLRGRIATRCGPVREGVLILGAAAERAALESQELAVSLLAEAVDGCCYAGEAQLGDDFAARARELVADSSASARSRFLAAMAEGMAAVLLGEGARGIEAVRDAVTLAEEASLQRDPQLLPWLMVGPLWLRERDAGLHLLAEVEAARARASLGLLPWLLHRVARHHAATESWAAARIEYDEAQRLARESGQRTELTAALAGLCWLEAREGRAEACRAHAEEALALCSALGVAFYETWALRALAELALAEGDPAAALAQFERVSARLSELGIGDVDLDPAPEMIDCAMRLERVAYARERAIDYCERARRKGQPWSLARACRVQALLAGDDERAAELFEQALVLHARLEDTFEAGCTRLAYGARLRRARRRTAAREQLHAALEAFERLGARPWAEMARVELAASGEHARRREPSTLDELTNQELQIARLLAEGRTTREAAAALFLSPKTIEYHLRSVYRKLGVKTRPDLARELGRLA